MDCTVVAGRGSGSLVFSQTLTNTADVVTLSTYRGSSFYVDCFNFAISNNAGCEGSSDSSGAPGSSSTVGGAVIEVWAVSTSPITGEQLGLHPLGQDSFGSSLLSAAYYFNETRMVYMFMRAVSMPSDCSVAEVSYTYSAYTSTAALPVYAAASALSTSAPFIAELSTKSVVRGFPVVISFDLLASSQPPELDLSAFQFTAIPFDTSFNNAQSTGSIRIVTTSRTFNNTATNVTTLLWTITFSTSGLYDIGLRAGSAKQFVYVGVVKVYSSNPAFFDIRSLDYIQFPSLNDPVELSIYGEELDLRPSRDTAKFVSTSARSCATALPAGGVPSATNFGPDDNSSAAVAEWNITFTIRGSFKMCYGHAAEGISSAATSWNWNSVPRFFPWAVNNRGVVPSAANAVSGAGASRNTTAVPQSTTRAPLATTTMAPGAFTSPPQSTTAAPSCTPIPLPSQCTLYADPNNNLQAVLTVEYREGGALDTHDWRGNLSKLLCVSIDDVALYELSNNPDTINSAFLVAGLLCNTAGPSYCDHATLLSALICLASNKVITTDVQLNASYQAVRDTLRIAPLSVLDASGVVSGISTANTTNHAAPSHNKVLTTQQVALISAAGVACIILAVVAVIAFIAYRKRQFLKQQWGRLGPGETFSTRIEHIPRAGDDSVGVELPPHYCVVNPINSEFRDDQRPFGLALPRPHPSSWSTEHGGIDKRIQGDVVDGVVLRSHHDQVPPLREGEEWEGENEMLDPVTQFRREATPPASAVVAR
jgi:hypothetical protein